MPFDPKLIHQAEAPLNDAGDLALPDDLLELATQLGDDAQHLAQVYPARQPQSESIGLLSATQVGQASSLPVKETDLPRQAGSLPHLRRTSRRLLRAVALVASLAAFAVGGTLWYPRGENDPQPRNLAATPERSDTETTHLTSTTDAANNSVSPAPPLPGPSAPPAAAPPPASRDTFLHEYSGPELEGIYDLIGDSEDDKISI